MSEPESEASVFDAVTQIAIVWTMLFNISIVMFHNKDQKPGDDSAKQVNGLNSQQRTRHWLTARIATALQSSQTKNTLINFVVSHLQFSDFSHDVHLYSVDCLHLLYSVAPPSRHQMRVLKNSTGQGVTSYA